MLTAHRQPFRTPFRFVKFINDVMRLSSYRAYRAGFGTEREKEKKEGFYCYIYYIQLYYYYMYGPFSVFAFLCELRAVSAVNHQHIGTISKSISARFARKRAVCAVRGSK
jgi:hypothetical protein